MPDTSFAAEGPGCEHYALQEDAQSDYERYEFLRGNLDPDGNGIACEELPPAADILPASIANAHVGRFIEGSYANQISVSPEMLITLDGITDGETLTETSPGSCPDVLDFDPLADLIPKGAIVFVMDATGNAPDLRSKVVPKGTAWVWDGIEDPINVNLWLVKNGFAVWDGSAANDRMLEQFQAANLVARMDERGVWGDCSDERAAIVSTFAPLSAFDMGLTPQRVVSLSGDWGERTSFTIPEDGNYTVTVRALSASSYIEIAVIRHLETDQEYPEFYWTLFGPDTYTTTVYFPAGTYVFDCRAAGGWAFSVDTIP